MKLLVLLSLLVVGTNCDRRQGYGPQRPRPTQTSPLTNPPLSNGYGPPDDGLIPCLEGQLRNVEGICVDAKVTRNLFVYAAPPEPTVPSRPRPQLPPPEIHKNIVIVRPPKSPPAPEPIVVPPPSQQNVIYVLKKRQQQQQRVINIPSQPESKPEVYFVHFDEDHDNPHLPGGIDLRTALATAAQGGDSVEDFLEGNDDSYPRHQPSSLYEYPIVNGQDPTNTANTPNLNGSPSYSGQYTVPRTFPQDSREDTIPAPEYIPPWLTARQNTPPQSIPAPRYSSPLNTSPQSTSQPIPPPPPGYNLPQYNPTQTNRRQSTSQPIPPPPPGYNLLQYNPTQTNPPQSNSQTIPPPPPEYNLLQHNPTQTNRPQSTSQVVSPPPPGYNLPQNNPTQTNRPQSTSPPQYLASWVTSPQGGSRYGPEGATGSSEVIPGTIGPSNRYIGSNQGPVLGGVDRYGGSRYGDDSDERGISRISSGEGGFIGILGDSGIVGDNNGRYGLSGASGENIDVSGGNNGRYGFNGKTTNGVRGGPDRNGVTTGNINRYIVNGGNGGLVGYHNNGNGFPHGFNGDASDEIFGGPQGFPEHRGRLVGGDAVAGNSYIPSTFVGDNTGEDNIFIGGNGNTIYRENRNGGLVFDDSAEDSIFYGNEHGPSVEETGVTNNRNGYQRDSDQNVRYYG